MKSKNLLEDSTITRSIRNCGNRLYSYWKIRFEPVFREPEDLNEALMLIIILNLLSHEDYTGYGLSEEVRKIIASKIKWRDLYIYLFLKRFENERVLKSYWIEISPKRKRKYYSILERGTKRLEELKSQFTDELKIRYGDIYDKIEKDIN